MKNKPKKNTIYVFHNKKKIADHKTVKYKTGILVRDRTRAVIRNANGTIKIPVKWEEVKEINFGSINKPNKRILGFKLIPMFYESDVRNRE